MLTQDDIIYFVITDRFANGDTSNDADVNPQNPKGYHGGDLPGIIDRLPYLQHLGVTSVWITPVFENIHLPQYDSWGYHGYWPLDFEKMDPHLYRAKPGIAPGSKQYLKEFVDTLHNSEMKVILDMVVNHVGYGHPALHNDPSTPIKAHWFNAPRGEQEIGDVGSWLNGLPDFNAQLPEVADYLVHVIADWIEETGVDCIRMDTAKHVESIFWQYYKTIVKGKFPNVSLLGEVLEFDIDRISAYQQHFAFDSLFDFPLQKAIEQIFVWGESFTKLSTPYSGLLQPGGGILDRDTHYTNHNHLVTLLDNHDLGERFFTKALNRMGGDRGWALQTNKLALTLLLTTRGIPQLYYGTEIGLEGGGDHANRPDMPWKIIGNGLEPDAIHAEAKSLHDHTRTLIALRRNSEALRYGEQITLYVDDRRYVYLRAYGDEWVIVGINLDEQDMHWTCRIDVGGNQNIPPRLREAIRTQRYVDSAGLLPPGKLSDGFLNLSLPKRSAIILQPVSGVVDSLAHE